MPQNNEVPQPENDWEELYQGYVIGAWNEINRMKKMINVLCAAVVVILLILVLYVIWTRDALNQVVGHAKIHTNPLGSLWDWKVALVIVVIGLLYLNRSRLHDMRSNLPTIRFDRPSS